MPIAGVYICPTADSVSCLIVIHSHCIPVTCVPTITLDVRGVCGFATFAPHTGHTLSFLPTRPTDLTIASHPKKCWRSLSWRSHHSASVLWVHLMHFLWSKKQRSSLGTPRRRSSRVTAPTDLARLEIQQDGELFLSHGGYDDMVVEMRESKDEFRLSSDHSAPRVVLPATLAQSPTRGRPCGQLSVQ